MKKTLKQLKEERQSTIEEMSALVNVAETEDRNLSADELATFEANEKSVDDLGQRIDRLERSLELTQNVAPVSHSVQDVANTDKDLKNFRFSEAIAAAYTGKVEGIVKEMDQEARRENRSNVVRGIGIPASVLQTRATVTAPNEVDVVSFIDQLMANSVLLAAGAEYYTGLSADANFPVISGITSSWRAESGATTTGSGALTDNELTPKKLISVIDMSAELLNQNPTVEAAFRANLARSVQSTFELALLKNAATTTNGPDSIYNDLTAVTNAGSAIALSEVYAAIEEVLANDINPADSSMGWIGNAAGIGAIQALAGADFSAGFFDPTNRTLATYRYFVSSNLANGAGATVDHAVAFGSWGNVKLGQFGGLSILFDPYTKADYGLGRLVCTSLVDGLSVNTGTAFRKIANAD